MASCPQSFPDGESKLIFWWSCKVGKWPTKLIAFLGDSEITIPWDRIKPVTRTKKEVKCLRLKPEAVLRFAGCPKQVALFKFFILFFLVSDICLDRFFITSYG